MTDIERKEFLTSAENTINTNSAKLDLFDEVVAALGVALDAIRDKMPNSIAIDNQQALKEYNQFHTLKNVYKKAKQL